MDALKASEETKLREQFDELIITTEAYLGSVLQQITKNLQIDPIPETVIILADSELMHLPLEALPTFRLADIKSVSRDFSLQIFFHRIKVELGKLRAIFYHI